MVNLLKVTFQVNVDVKANKSFSGSPEPILDASKINNKRSPWLSDSTVNWDSLSILIIISEKQRRANFTLILFTERRHVGSGGTIQLKFLTMLHAVTTCFTSLQIPCKFMDLYYNCNTFKLQRQNAKNCFCCII